MKFGYKTQLNGGFHSAFYAYMKLSLDNNFTCISGLGVIDGAMVALFSLL